MEGFDSRVLTVISYGDEGEISRVTVNPHNVNTVIAGESDIAIDGRYLRKTNVLYMDGDRIEINISLLDLTALEQAVGTYLV